MKEIKTYKIYKDIKEYYVDGDEIFLELNKLRCNDAKMPPNAKIIETFAYCHWQNRTDYKCFPCEVGIKKIGHNFKMVVALTIKDDKDVILQSNDLDIAVVITAEIDIPDDTFFPLN